MIPQAKLLLDSVTGSGSAANGGTFISANIDTLDVEYVTIDISATTQSASTQAGSPPRPRPACSASSRVKGRSAMSLIYSSGALKTFLDARLRGAPEEQLKALADEAVRANNQLQAQRARGGVVIDLAHARLRRSWGDWIDKWCSGERAAQGG
jgi:hypothetical protein